MKRLFLLLAVILTIALSVVLFAAPLSVAYAEDAVPGDTSTEETVDDALAENNTWAGNVAKWFKDNLTEVLSGTGTGLIFIGSAFGLPYLKKKSKKIIASIMGKISEVKAQSDESTDKVRENYTAVIGVVNGLVEGFNQYMVEVQKIMASEEQRKQITQQSALYSKATMDMVREAFAHSDLPKPNITMIELQYADAMEKADKLLALPASTPSEEEVKEAV